MYKNYLDICTKNKTKTKCKMLALNKNSTTTNMLMASHDLFSFYSTNL